MKLHANARTTPKTRQLLVERVLERGWTVRAAAAAVGISRSTAGKWVARYRAEGPAGLQDRSSAPRRIPHRTPPKLVRRIVSLRRQRLPAWRIAREIGRPRSTVCAVLRREGLQRLPPLQPPPPVVRMRPAEP